MNLRLLHKLLAPIRRRLTLMVTRGVLLLIDDDPKLQEIQTRLLAGEVMDGVERFQQYGFTSVPLPGAEAIALSACGHRSNTVIISVDDRRYRLQPLQGGEVAIYTDEDQDPDGCRIVLKRGNRVEIQARTVDIRGEELVHISGKQVEIHADERLETDVHGHGEAKNWLSGSTWHIDTYTDGSTFDPSTEHGIQPPEVE